MRTYFTLKALDAGKTVTIDKKKYRLIPGDIQIGDLYIAERNTGPHVLTAKKISYSEFPNNVRAPNFIVPNEWEYPFDWIECRRVEIVQD